MTISTIKVKLNNGIVIALPEVLDTADIREVVQYKYGDSVRAQIKMQEVYEASLRTSLFKEGDHWARVLFKDESRNVPQAENYKLYKVLVSQVKKVKEVPFRIERID